MAFEQEVIIGIRSAVARDIRSKRFGIAERYGLQHEPFEVKVIHGIENAVCSDIAANDDTIPRAPAREHGAGGKIFAGPELFAAEKRIRIGGNCARGGLFFYIADKPSVRPCAAAGQQGNLVVYSPFGFQPFVALFQPCAVIGKVCLIALIRGALENIVAHAVAPARFFVIAAEGSAVFCKHTIDIIPAERVVGIKIYDLILQFGVTRGKLFAHGGHGKQRSKPHTLAPQPLPAVAGGADIVVIPVIIRAAVPG